MVAITTHWKEQWRHEMEFLFLEATKKWRAELVDELHQKGAIQSTMADSSIASARKRNIEDELEDKAKDLAEAR